MILDLVTGKLRTLVSGWHTGIGWSWSPDSALIAYHQADRNFNNDIWILPADGSISPVNITRHPDNDRNPRWSADGKILSFISERRNEEYDVWMVYLDKNLETLTAKEREKYYEDAAKAAKKIKPLKIENPKSDKDADEKENEKNDSDDDPFEELSLHDAYLRLQRVTTLNGNESNSEITPAGDRTIFTGRTEKPGLFSIKWDGKE